MVLTHSAYSLQEWRPTFLFIIPKFAKVAYQLNQRRRDNIIYAAKQSLSKPTVEQWAYSVGNTGFEPVTSALSRQRSKPTELIAHK